jgi:TonB family protein
MKNYLIPLLGLILFIFSCNSNETPSKETVKNKTTTEIKSNAIARQQTVKKVAANYVKTDTQINNNSFSKPTANNASKSSNFSTKKDAISFSLPKIYSSFEKTATSFYITNHSKETLNFPEGTQLIIPADAFVLKDGGQMVEGQVEIVVKEFYNKKDFLLNNLSTMSNDRLLESGGTIHIQALANGQECELKHDKEIQILFPTEKRKKDMELFYGQKSNNEINWIQAGKSSVAEVTNTSRGMQLMSDIIEDTGEIVTTETRAQFAKGDKSMNQFIQRYVRYPEKELRCRGETKVEVKFTVAKDGTLKNIRCSKGAPKSFSREAVRLVKSFPKFIPAYVNGAAVEEKMIIPIEFFINTENVATAWSRPIEPKPRVVMKLDNYRKSLKQSVQNAKNINNLSVNSIANYAMITSRLGWINCDRFYKDNRPKINLAIAKKPNEEISIKLIFNRFRSIMTGYVSANRYTFKKIPSKENVTIFALKKVKNQVYLATQQLTVGSNQKVNLKYHPVAKNDLKQEIEKLNL